MIDLAPADGIAEPRWRAVLRDIAPFELDAVTKAVIVSPHPDDEVLALGGTIRQLALCRVPVTIIGVTDGEASHPGVPELAARRVRERELALEHLACAAEVVRLRQPDSAVDRDRVADLLAPLVTRASHVFAPLAFDGHPDHDACGQGARIACGRAGVRCVEYPVWMWNWLAPERFPRERARIIAVPDEDRFRKRRAIESFRSQVTVFEGIRILWPNMLSHFDRDLEVVFA